MSRQALPILFINLAGEMIYILEQRLQNVAQDKCHRVIKEIVMHMFDKRVLDDIFQPWLFLKNRAVLRNYFEKIAHCSIMRLSDNSMDKLFDLMTMTSKYQIVNISHPEQILMIAVNHLAGIKDTLKNDSEASKCLDSVHAMLMSQYRSAQPWEWLFIQHELLMFYQDCHVKVSVMVKEPNRKQQDDGTFFIRPPGEPIYIMQKQEPPGMTRYYKDGEVQHTDTWPVNRSYIKYDVKDSYNLNIDEERTTYLGTNLYKKETSLQIRGGGGTGKTEPAHGDGNEMKLFESLMGGRKSSSKGELMDLNMFDDDKEEKKYKKHLESLPNVTRIDAKVKKSVDSQLSEMKLGRDESQAKKALRSKGGDMLDLLDEAAARPSTAKKPVSRSQSRPSTRDTKERSASTTRPGSNQKDRPSSVKARSSSSNPRPPTGKTPAARPPTRTPSATRRGAK